MDGDLLLLPWGRGSWSDFIVVAWIVLAVVLLAGIIFAIAWLCDVNDARKKRKQKRAQKDIDKQAHEADIQRRLKKHREKQNRKESPKHESNT